MNAFQYRNLVSKMKNSKYHAKKVEIGGVVYDSKKEARRAETLIMQEKYGIIHNLRTQVPFILQDKFVNNKGEVIKEIKYVADFVYEQNGKKYVEDTKGFRTDVYKIKKKLFEHKYPEYTFVES